MNLRNFPIAIRLSAGFAVVALLAVLLGILALKSMSTMREQAVVVEETWVPELRYLTELNQNFMRFRIFTLRALLAEDEQEVQRLQSRMNEINDGLQAAERSFEAKAVGTDVQPLFKDYLAQKQSYQVAQAEVMKHAVLFETDEAMDIVNARLNPAADAVTRSLIVLEEAIVAGTAKAAAQSKASYEQGFLHIMLSIAAAALIAIVLAWLFTRSIVVPIRQAVEVSEVVASGDLTRTIAITGRDEPARLLRSLATMQSKLRDTIQGIASSSTQLAAAAEELNAVTEDASRGLQRQNDEVQQAATAVNEMSVAVDEVASNAVATSEQSKMTSTIAAQGQQQVGHTVTSIDKLSSAITSTATEVQELADKAQNITSVLDVIRAIAEQTNLLALNAAIEAARAGEQGRGFAVVADEVRALAHRTQQSTAEIEDMIGTIQQGTERAVAAMQVSKTMATNTLEQADAAGQALARITSAIGEINERNLVIASASEQQAQVAREVDRNLVNIRDLSTQSAAGAEQTSGSSRELSKLAVDLNDLVNRFRV